MIKDGILSSIYNSLMPSTFIQAPFKMINVIYLNLALETLSDILESGFLNERRKYVHEEYITENDLDCLEEIMRLMAGDQYESVRVFFEKNMTNSICEYLCSNNVRNIPDFSRFLTR